MKLNINITENVIEKFNGQVLSIDELLIWCSENSCSDLFIKVGTRPYVNRFGGILELNTAPLSQTEWNFWANTAISSERNAIYVRQKFYDFNYETGGHRYRVNVSYSEGQNILTARMISQKQAMFKGGPVKDINGWLEYPEQVQRVLLKSLCGSYEANGNYSPQRGIIIFSAPTGQGKSTTMQAAINTWKGNNRPLGNMNIITLEDPIEAIIPSKESTRITQKELNQDFKDFPSAISCAMREHGNIIIVGECRSTETVKSVIDIARSGHCAITTYHTSGPASTISRLLDNFSGNLSEANDLISQLSLIVCQRLDRRPSMDGYDLKVSYLAFDSGLRRILNKAFQNSDNIEEVISEYMRSQEDWRKCGNI